jgi:hypothetical protein
MLRITIGTVSTAILQTRLDVLTLNSSSQYDPLAAIVAIQNAPKVYEAEKSLDVATPPGVTSILQAAVPSRKAPHLPSMMQNITVDAALDSVARTFKGIVTYGICKQSDRRGWFYLDYLDGSQPRWLTHWPWHAEPP